MKTLYTTRVTAVGGRNGKVSSQDGILNLQVRAPKEMGGSGGATNPEQLFAAGYASCFDGALNLVARQGGTPLKNTEVTSEVHLLFSDEEGFRLQVDLFVRIPDTDPVLARELMEKAHHTCPYSKAIEGNVKVQLHLLEK
ncbi:MAG: organic hydroperoxide resistance protein [Candidatus Neomarinimicrobiota bacterium]|jgi:Ohr subfamily peroxiredoxin|nr:organic hydroperoxide resistance protein [Candidatus Neomarinimicrobiota bacterium]MDD3965589.1 organic hydroperoxide resistance protein [Candidatus Neomarinimicrobiota bacterium]MDX9779429.1 organic hydroperoxide resistance protein [bacterium]